jgi:hypothetical protein
MSGRPNITPERLALIQQCLDEGWPLIQITKTHGVCWRTMRRHFPEHRGLDRTTSAQLGAAARRATIRTSNAKV